MQKWAHGGAGKLGVITHQPLNLGQCSPPNTWWAPAGLSWESRGAHRLWGGRLWDCGDPRPRGVLAGSQPTGPGDPRGDPSQTPPFQLHGSSASH